MIKATCPYAFARKDSRILMAVPLWTLAIGVANLSYREAQLIFV